MSGSAMRIEEFVKRCQSLKILVIGDLMLDRYLWGKVNRVSPEAPVPVVDVSSDENRLGGAANVAVNIHSMGAQPLMCGVVGADDQGRSLIELAEASGFDTGLILTSIHRRTTVKIRVIANQQQVLRVDKEDRFPLNDEERQAILRLLSDRMHEADALIFQDYDKSLLDPVLISEVTRRANELQIPILVDPKFRHFANYADCSLFKPNLKELNEGLGLRLENDDLEGIARAVGQLRQRMPHPLTLVTLSENGMLLLDDKLSSTHIEAHERSISDVSGAGDTVIAVAALAIAAGLSPLLAAEWANLAGGLVCEEVGVASVDPERLIAEARGEKRDVES